MNDIATKIEIRDFRPEDWPLVKAIYQQGLDLNIATFQTECPTFEAWDRGHLDDCRFVAVHKGTVVAFAVLSPTSTREVYRGVVEVSIYLDPQYSRMGIGTKLLTHLVEQAQRQGYWSFYSSIIEENSASLSLHRKCGFREIGYRENIARDRFGTWHNTVLFELRSSSI